MCVYLLQVWPGNCERVEGESYTVCRSPATRLIERRDSHCRPVSEQFYLKYLIFIYSEVVRRKALFHLNIIIRQFGQPFILSFSTTPYPQWILFSCQNKIIYLPVTYFSQLPISIVQEAHPTQRTGVAMVDGQLINITRAEAYQLQNTIETNSKRSILAVKEHLDVDFGECSIIETIVSVTLIKINMEINCQNIVLAPLP